MFNSHDQRRALETPCIIRICERGKGDGNGDGARSSGAHIQLTGVSRSNTHRSTLKPPPSYPYNYPHTYSTYIQSNAAMATPGTCSRRKTLYKLSWFTLYFGRKKGVSNMWFWDSLKLDILSYITRWKIVTIGPIRKKLRRHTAHPIGKCIDCFEKTRYVSIYRYYIIYREL